MSISNAFQKILKSIIGESREEIWINTANELGATYKSGGILHSDKIILNHRGCDITLDMSAVTKGKTGAIYSRFTFYFINLSQFWFAINAENLFNKSMLTRHTQIDNRFNIFGNNSEDLHVYFSDPKLVVALQNVHNPEFGIKNKESFYGPVFQGETVMLQYFHEGEIKNPQEIKNIFSLMSVCIDRLLELNWMQDPNIR